MKKLLFASLLTVAVVFAQATGGSTGKASETKTEAGKKKHTKKGGKKSEKGKKGSSTTTTTPPPK